MIIALDLDRLIGRSDGSLPWRLPGDLARFKRLTMGGTVIVGRKTAETLPNLPGRSVHVASRRSYPYGELSALCQAHPSAWIAGGAQIYRAALELGVVTEVYATRVYHSEQLEESAMGPPFNVYAPRWEHDFTLTSVELGTDRNVAHELWRKS